MNNQLSEIYYAITNEIDYNITVSLVFSDRLPRRFLSDVMYIITNPKGLLKESIFDKLTYKYPLTHKISIWQSAELQLSLTLNEFIDSHNYKADEVLVVPPITLEKCVKNDFDDLCKLIEMLRAPGGCPWDAEQTHESLKTSLIEEAYEVLDAIDKEDKAGLIEELGDLLMQIVFHFVLEHEKDQNDINDIDNISTGIVKKMIYRHPHVFGNTSVAGSDEVLINWETLKNKEKHIESVTESMRRISIGMPALMRAKRVQKKASKIGFDWNDALLATEKIKEETEEVISALKHDNNAEAKEEFGDLLFSVVNTARLKGYEPELLLEAAIEKFISRFEKLEALVVNDYGTIQGHSLELLDKYWDIAKKEQKGTV